MKPTRGEAKRSFFESATWWIVATMVLAIPLVISPGGKDMFRLPKELLFRAGWIALLALALAAAVRGRSLLTRPQLREPSTWLSVAAVSWALVATLVSTNRALSLGSLAIVAGCALFFIISVELLRKRDLVAVVLVLVPSVVNALVASIQEWTAWKPIAIEDLAFDRHLMTTGLMGNPNDVGTLLMGPIVAAAAGSLTCRGRQRALMGGTLVILVAGLVASRTLTAILATGAALLIMATLVSWKRALSAIAILAALTLLLVTTYPPLAERSRQLRELVAEGNYNAVLTNRLTSFFAAAEMARDHPVTGIGPGTFGWHYFDYRLRAEGKRPELGAGRAEVQWNFNFGEVHNDHLELAAEAGFPAWILYIAALGLLGAHSLKREDTPSERARFAGLLALPLAAGLFVLTLAQFPLQLAGTLTVYLFLAAICVAWRRRDAV